MFDTLVPPDPCVAPELFRSQAQFHFFPLQHRRHKANCGHRPAVPLLCAASALSLFCLSLFILTGCGANIASAAAATVPGSSTSTPSGNLAVSSTSVSFGSVAVGQTASAALSVSNNGAAPIHITQVSLAGQSFSLAGQNTAPVTLDAGGSYSIHLQFSPKSTGTLSGQLTLSSDAASSGKAQIALLGSGAPAATTVQAPQTGAAATALSGFTCSGSAFTGAASDTCTVTLSGPAPSGGIRIALRSNSTTVTIPSGITLAAGARSASFHADILAVTAAHTVTLTAAAGSISKSFSLRLNAASPRLTLSAASLAFGTVGLNKPLSKSVSLNSSGTYPVTVSSASVSGKGFSLSGQSFPLTIYPGHSSTLSVTFDPTISGAAAGSLILTSNSSTGTKSALILSGAGAGTSTLRSLSCANAAVTGAATDACVVTLSGAAPAKGMTVALASSSTNVKLPAAIAVPANAASAKFNASILAVTTAQSVTLKAAAGSATAGFALRLNAARPTLTLSATSLAFGAVALGKPQTKAVTLTSSGTYPLTISGAAISGKGFAVSGQPFPLTIYPGHTSTLSVTFNPSVFGAVSGSLILASNSSTGAKTAIALSGTTQSSATLSGLTCASATVSGATSDLCTVTLTAPASGSGVAVVLSSSSSAVKVPASLMVGANASSAKFTAAVSAVSAAQKVMLGAQADGVARSYTLQLNTQSRILKLQSSSISFGNVTVNSSSTQSVTVTSAGTAPLTISAAAVSGTGFSIAGAGLPLTLNPGQSTTLNLQFNPKTAGTATGQVKLTSNADSTPTTSLALSGTGQVSAYTVNLSWGAPSRSASPVAGYRVYRQTSGTSSYAAVNGSLEAKTSYADSSVQSGKTYNYYVVSVDNAGNSSAPSNVFTVSIP